jgi:hypothetical protein
MLGEADETCVLSIALWIMKVKSVLINLGECFSMVLIAVNGLLLHSFSVA